MYKIIVIFAVLVSAGAQILLKLGADKGYSTLWKQYLNPWVIGGYLAMGGSLLLNIFCMSHGVQTKEVSIIEALSYLFVPCLSWVCLKEQVSWQKLIAISIIITGIAVFFGSTS